jgi:subtilase family serine protease
MKKNKLTTIFILLTSLAQAGDVIPFSRINFTPKTVMSKINGYTPAQLRHAYGVDSLSEDGTGQTVGIVVAFGSPTIQADLDYYSKTFGLPTTKIQIIYPQGKPSVVNSGWALETTLDVEMVHAMAPKANILLVVTSLSAQNYMMTGVNSAVSGGAKQVSMSWGSAESASEQKMDLNFNVPGVTFFASSGDSGYGVIYPAVSPYVVAVGGTTLNLDSVGNIVSQIGWQGSGGGISQYEPSTNFQQIWTKNPKRSTPDLSVVADPSTGVAVYCSTSYLGMSGWFESGGTSVSAPIMTGIMSLVNQAKNSSANGLSDFYLAAGAAPNINKRYYDDVTTGCNTHSKTFINCASSGFDTVTGLGSPVVQNLLGLISTMKN